MGREAGSRDGMSSSAHEDEVDRSIDVAAGRTRADGAAAAVRVAAAGDVHCHEGNREWITHAIAGLEGHADVLLLAGDLTTHGEPEQAAILAEACRGRSFPIFAVLGNHDWHADRAGEVTAVLADAGVTVLEREHAVCRLAAAEIGIVGLKGFVGGFDGHRMPDFGEPRLRALYTDTAQDVEALDRGLQAIAHCPVRVVLLHYAPIAETLEGEPPEIWNMLGTDRLAAPLVDHQPQLVLHGHAHAGRFAGALGAIPVHNVSVPVMQRDFWIFELAGVDRAVPSMH
jgi:Icc-related predicted phosphoesterase